MSFTQALVPTEAAAGVLRRLDRFGLAWIAAPYPYSAEPTWRVLCHGSPGVEGEHDVSSHCAAGIDVVIRQAAGVRQSSNWGRARDSLHRPQLEKPCST